MLPQQQPYLSPHPVYPRPRRPGRSPVDGAAELASPRETNTDCAFLLFVFCFCSFVCVSLRDAFVLLSCFMITMFLGNNDTHNAHYSLPPPSPSRTHTLIQSLTGSHTHTRRHFRSEWHRHNCKRSTNRPEPLPPLSKIEFLALSKDRLLEIEQQIQSC